MPAKHMGYHLQNAREHIMPFSKGLVSIYGMHKQKNYLLQGIDSHVFFLIPSIVILLSP